MFGSHAFTNGTTSASQNPEITFSHTGGGPDPPAAFDVTLTATNADGSDDEAKVGFITVFP